MKARAVRCLATWFCLLSCALTSVASGPGFVVCIGMDGHLDLGSLADGCRDCTEEELGSEPRSELAVIPASCCPCVDLPLPSGQDATHRTLSKIADLRWSASAPVVMQPTPVLAVLAPSPLPVPLGDASLSPQSLRRGVILRT